MDNVLGGKGKERGEEKGGKNPVRPGKNTPS